MLFSDLGQTTVIRADRVRPRQLQVLVQADGFCQRDIRTYIFNNSLADWIDYVFVAVIEFGLVAGAIDDYANRYQLATKDHGYLCLTQLTSASYDQKFLKMKINKNNHSRKPINNGALKVSLDKLHDKYYSYKFLKLHCFYRTYCTTRGCCNSAGIIFKNSLDLET